jgi:hypothetical protein
MRRFIIFLDYNDETEDEKTNQITQTEPLIFRMRVEVLLHLKK